MSEPTAQVSKMITASPEEIWAALTTPRIMKSYFLGADVSSDFQVGSPITFRGQFKGKSYEDHGAIQTADPQRRLAFTHFSPLGGLPDQPENYHTVTFDLAAVKGGTQVTLTRGGLTARHRPEAAGSRARPARPARRGAGWTTGCRSSAGSGPRRP